METEMPAKQPQQSKTYEKISAEMTPEVENLLLRYLEIQRTAHELEDEKSALQEKLAGHLSAHHDGFWFPAVREIPLKVRFFRETEVEYDENLLQSRLGEKYRQILKPDIRKIRSRLAEIEEVLAPVIDKIGSPDRGKVREAITSGAIRAEEFAGAFRKRTRTRLSVSRLQQEEE